MILAVPFQAGSLCCAAGQIIHVDEKTATDRAELHHGGRTGTALDPHQARCSQQSRRQGPAAALGEPAEIRRPDAIWGLCLRQLMAELLTRVIRAVLCAAMVCMRPLSSSPLKPADAHALGRSCWLPRLPDHEAA